MKCCKSRKGMGGSLSKEKSQVLSPRSSVIVPPGPPRGSHFQRGRLTENCGPGTGDRLRQCAHAAAKDHRGEDERRQERRWPDEPCIPGDVDIGRRLEPRR